MFCVGTHLMNPRIPQRKKKTKKAENDTTAPPGSEMENMRRPDKNVGKIFASLLTSFLARPRQRKEAANPEVKLEDTGE
jgi:hypothetical protein